MKSILTIDPGVYTLGACLFSEDEFLSSYCALPYKRLAIDRPRKERDSMGHQVSMKHLINRLRTWFDAYEITECYCEKPSVFGSARGWASKDHILQLEMFRGMLFNLCDEYHCLFHDVNVSTWKGQLPKHLVVQRIKDIYYAMEGRQQIAVLSEDGSHDWDACGIGLHVQGFFK